MLTPSTLYISTPIPGRRPHTFNATKRNLRYCFFACDNLHGASPGREGLISEAELPNQTRIEVDGFVD